MPKKQKGKAKGNNPKPKSRTSLNDSFVPLRDGGSSASTPRPHFSLRDEVQATDRHHSKWTPSLKLRAQAISFVSAGAMHPVEDANVDQANAQKHTEAYRLQVPQTDAPLDSDLDGSDGAMAHMDLQSSAEITMDEAEPSAEHTEAEADADIRHAEAAKELPLEQPLFFVDVAGDKGLTPSGPKPRVRSPSPALSNSSDEVVLFRGRKGPVTIRDDPAHKSTMPAEPEEHVTDALMDMLADAGEPQADERAKEALGWAKAAPRWPMYEVQNWVHADGSAGLPSGSIIPDDEWSAKEPTGSRKGKNGRKRQNRQLRMQADLNDDLMQDYMDNMDRDALDRLANGNEPAPGSTDDWAWTSSEMSEGDEVKSAEAEATIDKVLNGDESSDPSLDSSGDDGEEDDEDEEMGDSSDLEAELEYTEREQWEDDADLRQKQRDLMTDEEIARILAKQEDLGMGGDDLYLFDDSGFGDLGAARAGLRAFSGNVLDDGFIPSRTKGKKKRGRKEDHFPDASLMADVLEQEPYGGFDIMDFDRPSLRRKAKGRKSAGPIPEELADISDEDLVDGLQATWAADRNKKKSRKAEREELRVMGLLGKGRNGKADLGVKYFEGITLAQVKHEIIEFLDNEHTTKAFPPMEKHDRKILHDIAGHFNLNSKSQGKSKGRFTVMIKTQRTIEFSESHWQPIEQWASKGFFKNMNTSQRKYANNKVRDKQNKTRGGMSKSAVSYANGEVVGAAAPELAESNFGRRLMEKMGWTKGTALGKEGVEGRLLVPVEARIKSGKAGLG